MSATDVVITGFGLFGVVGSVILYLLSCRAERSERRQLMLITGATRLLDGERFPLALDNYEGDV